MTYEWWGDSFNSCTVLFVVLPVYIILWWLLASSHIVPRSQTIKTYEILNTKLKDNQFLIPLAYVRAEAHLH